MRRVILGVCLFACSFAWGSALSVSGRAGVSEFYLRYSLKNYPGLFDLCLAEKYCVSGTEDLFNELNESHLFDSTSLLFLTSRELGSRLYRMDPGGVIALNRDLLFIARNGVLQPWSYSDAVDFISRAFAEKLGWSARETSILTNRMTELALNYADRTAAPESYLKQFGMALFREPVSALILEDTATQEESVTLEVPFQAQLSCGPSTGMETQFSSFRVATAKWANTSRSAHDHALLAISGTIEYKCEDPRGKKISFTSNYNVQVDAHLKGTLWYLTPSSLRILQNGIHALAPERD